MRKLTSTLLLVATLFANIAWAMDAHAETFFGHDAEWSEVQSQDHDSHGDDGEIDDHCCHGLAHLSGFILGVNLTFGSFLDSHSVPSVEFYTSRSQAPPTPPPNA